MSRRSKFLCLVQFLVAGAFICGLAAPLPAHAAREVEESEEAGKLNTFIGSSIEPGLNDASNRGQNQRAIALVDRIIALWENENYQTAEAQKLKIRAIANAMERKANLLRAMKHYEEAATLFIKLDQKSTDGISKMHSEILQPDKKISQQLFEIGDPDRYTMQGGTVAHPFLIEAGSCYVQADQYDKAISFFQKYCADYPVRISLPAHVELSKIYLYQGKPQAAEKEFTDLLTEPDFVKSVYLTRCARVELKRLYLEESKKSEADKIEALLQDKRCPKCGLSEHVLPIAYGLMHSAPKDVVLGGCCTDQYSPRWCCTTDKTRF